MSHNVAIENRKAYAEYVYQQGAMKQAVAAITETYNYEASVDAIADTVSRYDGRSYNEWLDQSEGVSLDAGMYW